ncbi:hypothetical protein G6F57_014375 [Rhizopus arrhizus]|nr:hypothetical protein G6F57_014375 [Rhizopus arrhizus]
MVGVRDEHRAELVESELAVGLGIVDAGAFRCRLQTGVVGLAVAQGPGHLALEQQLFNAGHHGSDGAARAATDCVTRHAAQCAAGQHADTAGFVVLDHDRANARDRAGTDDLLTLGLVIAIHTAGCAAIGAATQDSHRRHDGCDGQPPASTRRHQGKRFALVHLDSSIGHCRRCLIILRPEVAALAAATH